MKTWVGVTIGVVALVFVGLATLVAGGVYFFVSHFDFEDASDTTAAERFEKARSFLGNQPALRTLDGRE